jgi:8-oxo-dGTP pyrophosphatase MutT (NUDIX family)
MQDMNFINKNYSPYLGILLAVLSVIPTILNYTILKPKFNKIDRKKLSKKEIMLEFLNKVIYLVNIFLLILNTNNFDIKNANIWFGIMLFFYIIYYELYIRYVIRKRTQKWLYEPFLYVKIPIYISMSLALVFAGIWSNTIMLVITSIMFTITNCFVAYRKYINFFTEYRDLYDENRKLTGRKMLKDGILPKGLKYVTVIVFIYNPKNKKWLMQKRTKDKGGKWATTSGHPVSGQTSSEGMITEIKEELGIDVEKDELNFVTTVNRKHKFADIYYLEKNINISDIKLQKEEVDDVKWMSDKDVEAFYMDKNFKKTHYNYYNELKINLKR